MTVVDRDSEIVRVLKELHATYLKSNKHDEGDLLYYRINYRLADTFALTKEEAESYHVAYHQDSPRKISEGYCDFCKRVVKIIPILYGVAEKEVDMLREAEAQGRIIIGTEKYVATDGRPVPMYGCQVCKGPLHPYRNQE